eukprot:XP_023156135.1 uncharacterized protein LOC111589531 [Zea mays]
MLMDKLKDGWPDQVPGQGRSSRDRRLTNTDLVLFQVLLCAAVDGVKCRWARPSYKSNLTGRIIDERRRRLKSDVVEMLTCIKDWEDDEARMQHMVYDKELEETFENLYID